MVEILGKPTPRFVIEIRSKLPCFYLIVYMHVFQCESSLYNGDCKNNKPIKMYGENDRSNGSGKATSNLPYICLTRYVHGHTVKMVFKIYILKVAILLQNLWLKSSVRPRQNFVQKQGQTYIIFNSQDKCIAFNLKLVYNMEIEKNGRNFDQDFLAEMQGQTAPNFELTIALCLRHQIYS